VSIESLPSANIEDNSTPCDVCVKKEEQNVPAVIYCTVCRKLFCRKHEEVVFVCCYSCIIFSKFSALKLSSLGIQPQTLKRVSIFTCYSIMMCDDHQKMVMSDYKLQAARLKARVCPKHKGHPLSVGCKACVQLFCVQCLSETNSCIAGKYLYLCVI